MFKSQRLLKRHVEYALVNILKDKFTDNTDYPYTISPRTRKIDITTVYPEKMINPDNPIIVVEESQGDFTKRVIGRRHIKNIYEDVVLSGMTVGLTFYPAVTVSCVTAEIRGETYPFKTPITVSTMNPRILSEVQGAILEYLLDEDLMATSGLVVTDIQAMTAGERVIGNDVFLSGTVELSAMTCYETTVTIADSDRIGKITTQPIAMNIDGTTM